MMNVASDYKYRRLLWYRTRRNTTCRKRSSRPSNNVAKSKLLKVKPVDKQTRKCFAFVGILGMFYVRRFSTVQCSFSA